MPALNDETTAWNVLTGARDPTSRKRSLWAQTRGGSGRRCGTAQQDSLPMRQPRPRLRPMPAGAGLAVIMTESRPQNTDNCWGQRRTNPIKSVRTRCSAQRTLWGQMTEGACDGGECHLHALEAGTSWKCQRPPNESARSPVRTPVVSVYGKQADSRLSWKCKGSVRTKTLARKRSTRHTE